MNRFLVFVKWPVALAVAWMTPAAAMLLWHIVVTYDYSLHAVPPILSGFVGYMLLWWFLFRKQVVGSYLSTLEHELTHALFAIITGHSITSMRVTMKEGGQVVYKGGEGNWLIIIAPYFFPTITMVLLLIRMFIVPNVWFEAGIGISIGFHVGSTFYETHGGQTDLKKAGWIFSFLFLPGANLFTYTMISQYLNNGWNGIRDGFMMMWGREVQYSIWVWEVVKSLRN